LDYLIKAGFAILTKSRRNLHKDALMLIKRQKPGIELVNANYIPNPPFLITVNHFSKPGFSALWLVMAINSAVKFPTRWMMTNAWTFPGRKFHNLYEKISTWIFKRIAQVYQFILTPALPAKFENSIQAAMAIREIIRYARSNPTIVIGLAPEGQDFPGGVLGMPTPGTGLLINEIIKIHPQILPVGFYYKDGHYVTVFGEPYQAIPLAGDDRKAIDKIMILQVMKAIAVLLPIELQGEFRE
jgi:hypothetical protein